MPTSSVRFAQPPQKNNWYLVSGVMVAIVLIASAVGLVIFQSTLEEPQDIRQQATVAEGKVDLSFSPASATNLQVGVAKTIDLKINTHGYQIDGVELVFNIIAPGLSAAPELVATHAGLQAQVQEVEQSEDGYLVAFKALVPPTGSFSSTQPTTFAQLTLTPSQAGELSLNFDVEDSLVTIRNASPVQDELKTIDIISYQVLPAATASPSVSPSPSLSPSPTVSPSPGVGGTTLSQCNGTCSSNDDCPADHRCYDTGSSDGKRCRLVTNVSSTTCSNPPAAPLNRQCNEYCADARECATGYACYFNKCRHPQNVESQTCAAPTTSQQQAISQSCNQTCSTNRDCAANMRCFHGSCRLASNPSSTSCSLATSKSVSSSYQKGGTTTGGTQAGDATKSGSILNPTGTQSAGLIKPSVSPSPSPSPVPSSEEEPTSLLTAWLPKLLLGAGILLLLIVLTFIIARLLRGNRRPPQPPVVTRSADDQKYEQQLEDKIKALRQESRPVSSVPPLVVQPMAQPQFRPQPEPVKVPPVPRPEPMTQPVKVAEAPVFARTAPPVAPAQPTPQATAHSSMMDRIRHKGITPPGSDQR